MAPHRPDDTPVNDEGNISQVQMEIALPTDGHSCLRVECPRCGLDFKLDMASEGLRDVVSWSVSRVLRSEGVRDVEIVEPRKSTHCPYCSCRAASQDFLHPDHWAYLQRLLFREYVEPLFATVLDSALGGLRNNKFVSVTHTSGPRSARPTVGPEGTDMVRVRCVACSNLFKVNAGWRGSIRCAHCALEMLAM